MATGLSEVNKRQAEKSKTKALKGMQPMHDEASL